MAIGIIMFQIHQQNYILFMWNKKTNSLEYNNALLISCDKIELLDRT